MNDQSVGYGTPGGCIVPVKARERAYERVQIWHHGTLVLSSDSLMSMFTHARRVGAPTKVFIRRWRTDRWLMTVRWPDGSHTTIKFDNGEFAKQWAASHTSWPNAEIWE